MATIKAARTAEARCSTSDVAEQRGEHQQRGYGCGQAKLATQPKKRGGDGRDVQPGYDKDVKNSGALKVL
jgi:hypothetical protein